MLCEKVKFQTILWQALYIRSVIRRKPMLLTSWIFQMGFIFLLLFNRYVNSILGWMWLYPDWRVIRWVSRPSTLLLWWVKCAFDILSDRCILRSPSVSFLRLIRSSSLPLCRWNWIILIYKKINIELFTRSIKSKSKPKQRPIEKFHTLSLSLIFFELYHFYSLLKYCFVVHRL